MQINFNEQPYIVIDKLIRLYIIIKKDFNVNLSIEESLKKRKLILDNGEEFDIKLIYLNGIVKS